ncbi:hypothetical protein CCR79_12730 [Halorhodospira halophila]|nr:hypothetical protein [Halorhodospira halophila]
MGPDHSGYWYYSDDDLLLSSWGTERYRAHGQAPAKELQEELEMNGLAPAEYEAPESAELTFNTLLGVEEEEAHSAPVNLGALPPLSSVYARARGMARRIAMEAQRLRIEPTRIRLAQLGTLLQTLESIFTEASAAEEHERKKDNEARCLRWETALLASIALLTGSPPVSMATVLDPLADIKIDPPCRSQPAVFSLSR